MTQGYKRLLIKLSGEALAGGLGCGIDDVAAEYMASEVCDLHKSGVQVAIVVGGGNFYRGASKKVFGMERASADYMGMLATVINALALQNAIERAGVACRVLSAIPMTTVCEPYIRRRALRHLEKGRIVVFAGGTGNPFFTTDTAAALRAIEMGCDALFKGTQVDGVYTADPKSDSTASRYEKISYKQVISEDLRVMDASAVSLAMDNDLPIVVFELTRKGMLRDIVMGGGVYTLISK